MAKKPIKYITITVRMKSKMGEIATMEGKTIIKDGITLTSYNNPKQTELTYKAMRKDGKKCALKSGVIIEKYEGMKMHHIADKIEGDLNKTFEKLKKVMDISVTREYIQ